MQTLIETGLILVLILANGVFAASEIAIVSARRNRLEQRAEEGEAGAAVALRLAENPNRFLSTVQVGITLIGTFAAAFGGANLSKELEAALGKIPAIAPYAQSIALTSVVLLISYASLILGELVPKRLALQNAEQVATRIAPIMQWIDRLAAPVIAFLSFSTEMVLRAIGRRNVTETPINEEDIMALVREGTAGGTVEESEHELITNVFTFTDRTVRTMMTPRTRIVAVEINTSAADVLQTITESGYSRIPVYQGTLDHIAGMLYVKDLLHAWGHPERFELRTLLRPALYIPESQRAVVAFQHLKERRSSLGIVLDEYGQVAGVISIEDMLEELVGDLSDEYDEADEGVVRREDGSYLVDGLMPFNDFQEHIQLPDADEVTHEHSFETVAGFVLALLGRIPAAGEQIIWQGYTFEIIDMDKRRIDKVLVRPPDSVQEAEE